jgi:hypothetical protein
MDMPQFDRYNCTDREFRSVKLYEGGKMPGETDEFYRQKSAYKTLNLLMMAGREGEYVRVCVEGQKPTGLFIRRWEDTMQALTDIFAVQCRCALSQKAAGKPLPHPLSRGDRGVNFRLMEAAGGTFAFTSTTEGEVLDDFVRGKQDPHALHMSIADGVPYLDFQEFLGEDYYYTDQREILLPPMVKMACGPCRTVEHEGIGPVRHYDIRFTHVDTDMEFRDDAELTAVLNELRTAAAEGLDDLAANRENAAVLRDGAHPYWKWKDAFRRLATQRMAMIYREYYR